MQQRSLYTFKSGDTICFYHEKVYHTCYETLQLPRFDRYQVHKKKIGQGLHIPESTIAVKNETRAKSVYELYEIVSRKIKL